MPPDTSQPIVATLVESVASTDREHAPCSEPRHHGVHDDGVHDDGVHDDGVHDDGVHDDGVRDDGIDDDPRRHLTILAASMLVLLVALVLQVHESRQVVLPVVGTALPEVCGFRNVFGVDCPGCGLTRSFISLAHGDPSAAWRFNPLGIVFFSVLLFQLPFRSLQLLRIRNSRPAWQFPLTATSLLCGLSVGLIVQWLVRLVV